MMSAFTPEKHVGRCGSTEAHLRCVARTMYEVKGVLQGG